ncbi:forkhead-associated domain-containing protein 1-like [Clavelina lepadiformis]|uniref:FHA domain-containing protein n=1 Tax=Clavelina lepadiformis TaxID=159417 RepID=A0ABP0GTZ8_CLALP
MVRKGYLKSPSGINLLQQCKTTIGKGNCDVVIEDNSIDQQHAIIEYSINEDCFVLHDLNSAQGTYVNDCRVQNAAVRLAPGDVIRFGYTGKPYELQIDDASTMTKYLPVQQRPSWDSPIQIVVSSPRSERSSTLPLINLTSSAAMMTPQKSSCVYPHPPLHCRSYGPDATPQVSGHGTISFSNIDHKKSSQEDWLSSSNSNAEHIVREKETKIIQMGDEINRLALFEQESKRKDSTISCLREDLAHLQERLANEKQLTSTQVFQKLQAVEKEICSRRNEVAVLRQQLDATNTCLNSSPTLTAKLTDSEKKVHTLRQELDKSKREYGMSQGLVQSLQKEIQTKESVFNKMKAELDHLKKEFKKKDVQLSSMSSKFTRITEDRTKDDMIEALKKETKDLKIKLKTLESRATDQVGLLQTYKEEIVRFKSKTDEAANEKKHLITEHDDLKQKYYELQRKERILRVDLEQSQSRLDRFRMRILHTVYAAPGLNAPDDLQSTDDNVLVNDIKKLIAFRSDLKDQVHSLQNEMKALQSFKGDIDSSKETCTNALEDIIKHLSEKGHHSRVLKNQADLLSSLSLTDDNVSWIYKSFVTFLNCEIQWVSVLDEALQKAGYDISITDQNPSVYVNDLHRALDAEKEAHKNAMASYKDLESQHHKELQSNINKLLIEHEEKLNAEIERVRMEEKALYEESLKNAANVEEEKCFKALNEEREKIRSANLGIEQLQKLLLEKQSREGELESMIQQARENIEKHKNKEQMLQEELAELQRNFKLEMLSKTENFEQMKKNYETDIKQYKEEIHQHSITIVSMEKQVQALTKQYQDSENQLKNYLEKIKEAERRRNPTPPPQQMVDPDLAQQIQFLKSELLHANHEINMQQSTITALRRDLTGAQARISDMTGELSESQKRELEYNRNLCKNQETELNSIRQKLLKMSGLVDSQKDQIEKLHKELKEKDTLTLKQRTEAVEQKDNVKDLQHQLEQEKSKSDKQTQAKSTEGKITLELSSVGAQCRGDRHEEIIFRQREALAELRARIKALEQIRPPLPSQEQALQQVILLKKELAEIRAKQAIEEDRHFQAQMSLDKEVVDSHQQLRSATTQASIERTSREQLQNSLESSEKNYFDLLNSVSSLLGVNSLQGAGSMQHLPPDEREKLSQSRRMDCNQITSSVKSVIQQLDRKEQLLQGYEKDLGKLREAESFASHKSSRVEVLSRQLMEKAEEIDHLREALSQTNESLEIERRLNKSIKQRQTFYLENLDYRRPPPQGKSTYTSEFDSTKREMTKKKRNDKVKRKQYEINVLKQRVLGNERELCDTTARLINMGRSSQPGSSDEISNIYRLREKSREEDLLSET